MLGFRDLPLEGPPFSKLTTLTTADGREAYLKDEVDALLELREEAQRKGGLVVKGRLIAPPEFDKEQVYQVRQGIEAGLDVSIYARPEFDPGQMQEIVWGLGDGLNVSAYADPGLSSKEMDKRRVGLLAEKRSEAPAKRRSAAAPGM